LLRLRLRLAERRPRRNKPATNNPAAPVQQIGLRLCNIHSIRRFRIVALHLIKLCVGCDSVKDLGDWIRTRLKDRKRRGLAREHLHTTRMVPKRAAELTDGGSLYWIIRGHVMCRQRILAVRPFMDKEGVGRCRLALDPKLTLVEPRPWRAFQGWRYLAPKEAPRDLDHAAPGAKMMPEELRRELRELGLL
jgi:hypothetical protein